MIKIIFPTISVRKPGRKRTRNLRGHPTCFRLRLSAVYFRSPVQNTVNQRGGVCRTVGPFCTAKNGDENNNDNNNNRRIGFGARHPCGFLEAVQKNTIQIVGGIRLRCTRETSVLNVYVPPPWFGKNCNFFEFFKPGFPKVKIKVGSSWRVRREPMLCARSKNRPVHSIYV